jgi:predicted DsbA family dithiol-disulfide isomerase
MPFDLHPEYPPEGILLADLHRRYGIGTGSDDPLVPRFAAAGIVYDRPEVVPSSRAALRLAELARGHGLHERLHGLLMDAYWSQAVNIGDPAELRRLGAEAGLPADEVERVLTDPTAYLDAVESSTGEAHSAGINAVPAFVLDGRLLVLGAQPIEVFRQAFAQLDA